MGCSPQARRVSTVCSGLLSDLASKPVADSPTTEAIHQWVAKIKVLQTEASFWSFTLICNFKAHECKSASTGEMRSCWAQRFVFLLGTHPHEFPEENNHSLKCKQRRLVRKPFPGESWLFPRTMYPDSTISKHEEYYLNKINIQRKIQKKMDGKTLKEKWTVLDGLHHLCWSTECITERRFVSGGYHFLSLTLLLLAFKKYPHSTPLHVKKGLCWPHVLSAQWAVQAASPQDAMWESSLPSRAPAAWMSSGHGACHALEKAASWCLSSELVSEESVCEEHVRLA